MFSVGVERRTVTASDRVARVSRVEGLVGAGPDVVFNEELRALAGINAIAVVIEDVVVKVTVAKAERGRARVEVHPTVECVRHRDCLVLRSVAVRVADEGRLPVVVQVRVRDRDAGGAVGDIEEAVVATGREKLASKQVMRHE